MKRLQLKGTKDCLKKSYCSYSKEECSNSNCSFAFALSFASLNTSRERIDRNFEYYCCQQQCGHKGLKCFPSKAYTCTYSHAVDSQIYERSSCMHSLNDREQMHDPFRLSYKKVIEIYRFYFRVSEKAWNFFKFMLKTELRGYL